LAPQRLDGSHALLFKPAVRGVAHFDAQRAGAAEMRAIGVRLRTALTLVILLAGFAAAPARGDGFESLTIETSSGPHAFQVEIARDDATRERGLMDRRYMAPDHGMLFEFDRDAPVSFWMKNTYIPLDMIFISRSGVVTRIVANAEPLSERVIPSGPACAAVLELNGGAAASIGLKVGDRVRHPFFKP
jgi:uncharacterized membrane protein (UPF0127 family)